MSVYFGFEIRFGIFPSWGLSQKLSRIIGANKAREVSLTATPLTAEVGERLGFVNHVVGETELLKKAWEIAEAIVKNNQDMVVRYKAVINDGVKLDLGHALTLEKVCDFDLIFCGFGVLYPHFKCSIFSGFIDAYSRFGV